MLKREGIVFGMSHAEYRSGEEVSNSRLSDLAVSAADCWALNMNPDRPPEEVTDAKLEGNVFHTLVLEPEEFAKRYIVKPDGMSFATKEGKAWRDAAPVGLTIIKHDQMHASKAQEKALREHPQLGLWLGAPYTGEDAPRVESEVSMFWTDKKTGLRCKSRPDRIFWPDPKNHPTSVILIDLKRIADNSETGFRKASTNMAYHRQRAHYVKGAEANGLEVIDFVFATVPGTYPYIARPYTLGTESVLLGHDENRDLLDAYAAHLKADDWRLPEALKVVDLMPWAFPRETDEDVEVRDVE